MTSATAQLYDLSEAALSVYYLYLIAKSFFTRTQGRLFSLTYPIEKIAAAVASYVVYYQVSSGFGLSTLVFFALVIPSLFATYFLTTYNSELVVIASGGSHDERTLPAWHGTQAGAWGRVLDFAYRHTPLQLLAVLVGMWAAISLAIPAVTAYAPSDYTVPALYNLMLLAPWPLFLPILALRLSNLLERAGTETLRPGQRRLFGFFYLHKAVAAAIVAVALLFLPHAPALCGLVFVWVWASCQLSNQVFTNHFLRPVGERVSVSTR